VRAPAAFAAGAVVAGLAVAALSVPLALSAGALSGGGPQDAIKPVSCGADGGAVVQVVRNAPKMSGWDASQVRNAAIIVRTGQDQKVPPRGWVVAVATSMQEATLRNLGNLGNHNDHDSLGLFQQRPSTGWGTPAQVMDPVHASTAFYAALLKVKGWQSLPLTRAAQRVQRSAYPDAYAKWEDDAAAMVDRIAGGAAKTAATAAAAGRCAGTDQVASSGWVRPVKPNSIGGFRTAARPTHQGVDLMVKRGTPIRAAAAGVVVHMECDKAEAGYDCNRDGSSSTPGCGWYVDIEHAAGVVTRYCHQLRRPLVAAGDKVTAGQVIGVVGTSGHSSGPHLHFEVHLHGDRSSNGAVDPVPFMKAHGAPLDGDKAVAV
jgi:biotin carboxyl carrier protein